MSVHIPVWRIGADTPDYEAHDMSGKGAERTGGRWNRLGTPMLYAASSRALACLESVVHVQAGALPLNRYLVELLVPIAAPSGFTASLSHQAIPDGDQPA